jgi:magnesium transporter
MLRNPLLIPDLREMLRDGEQDGLREFFAEFHPASAAEILQDLEPHEAEAVFGLLEDRVRAAVMSYLEPDEQVRIIERLTPGQAADLLHWMPHDDRADLVNRLDEDRAEDILRGLAHADREDIRRLTSYEAGTAGSVMTTDYVALPPQISVREAIDQLRREAPDRETIDYSYVVDPRRRLIGSVSLKRLILARPSARIEDIMETQPIVARVDEDQESVAHKIQDYDLIAIPVVDATDQLVGIVTHDDALDILRQEQTEDILKFGGVSAAREPDEDSYWQGRVVESVRRRIGWLLFLFVGGTITSFVVGRFGWVQGRISHPSIKLEAFIALLIGTGGNAGSQAVGTIIRALALGEIEPSDAGRVLAREWLTGTLLGALLGSLGFLYYFLLGYPVGFAAVIGLSVLGICMWSNSVGALVPLVAKRLGIDPAVVSAPLISTLVDATGLIIYYTIAILVLVRLFGRS